LTLLKTSTKTSSILTVEGGKLVKAPTNFEDLSEIKGFVVMILKVAKMFEWKWWEGIE
jgi:hypothetical protein